MFDTLILILLGFSITLVVSVPSILSTTLLVLSIILALVSVAGMAVARSDRLARRVTRLAVSPAPQRWKPKVATFIGEFIVGLQPLKKPQLFPVLVVLTAIVWFIEAGVYYLVALAFGLDLGAGDLWLGILFAVAASNLLTAAPSSSGGIGPFEFGAQRTLVHFGVTQATATAFALVIHATLLLPVVAAGLFFLWVYHIPFRTISREAVAPPARLGSTVAGGNKEQ